MYDNEMYHQLVFYLEACYSGSMFLNILPPNINIYATTAANERESSYAKYCGRQAVVRGTSLGTCMGDEYSVNWMEDSEKRGKSYTVSQQYEHVKQKTRGSHVMEFGDLSVSYQSIWNFQGPKRSNSKLEMFRELFESRQVQEPTNDIIIRTEDAIFDTLYARTLANDDEATQMFIDELQNRINVDRQFNVFERMLKVEDVSVDEIKFECLEDLIDTYAQVCQPFGEYELTKAGSFIKACNSENSMNQIKFALQRVCN